MAFDILFIVVCKFKLAERKQWHKIRGAQMITIMKSVSVGFDFDMET